LGDGAMKRVITAQKHGETEHRLIGHAQTQQLGE
jgi:hypothetical protein